MATGGTDSGVETGNESNDQDDISVNLNVNVNLINEMGDPIPLDQGPNASFESSLNSLQQDFQHFQNIQGSGLQSLQRSPSSDHDPDLDSLDPEKDVPPPPPPTSPNICGTGPGDQDQSDFPDVCSGIGVGQFSDSLDGMQGDPAEDCELELEEEEEDCGGGGGDMDEVTMDRDFCDYGDNGDQGERQGSSGHGSYSPSPPFLNDFSLSGGFDGYSASGGSHFGQVSMGFCSASISMERRRSEFSCLQSNPYPHNLCSPPPGPPATPTNNSNSCRAIVKFEFPDLPKLVCDFVEPPAGLRSFLTVEPFSSSSGGGYSVLNTAPSTNDCRSLIPYEQHDLHQKVRSHARTIRNKLYDNWSNLRREYNERRLRTAAGAGSHLMVQKLLGSGVDPNSSDEMGRSPLHIAACKGYSDIVRLLLQSGANPNQKDSVGNTPLHLSACTNHFDVVTDLLRAGTDVSTLDNNGRNPLQLAQSKLKMIMQSSSSSKNSEENDDTSGSSSQSQQSSGLKVKKEVQQIIEMMTEYLQKKGQDLEAELLNEFANRLTLSQTPQEVDDLLANLSSLSITAQHNPNPLSGQGQGQDVTGLGGIGGRSRAMTVSNSNKPPRNPYLIPNLNPSLARPRSASFSAPSSNINFSFSNSNMNPGSSQISSRDARHRNLIKPGILGKVGMGHGQRERTVHEEQQILMSQCNND